MNIETIMIIFGIIITSIIACFMISEKPIYGIITIIILCNGIITGAGITRVIFLKNTLKNIKTQEKTIRINKYEYITRTKTGFDIYKIIPEFQIIKNPRLVDE